PERYGVALTVAGLAGLLLLTGSAAPTHALGPNQAITVGLVAAAAVGLLLAPAMLAGGPIRRGLCCAAASGIASGVGSALTQTVTVRLGPNGWAALVSPAALLVLAFAPGGLLLAQAGYRYGLGGPLAVLTIVNPVAAATIGIALLDERFT